MISEASRRVTGDAAKHLNERLTEVLVRHASIMQSGGMSTAEAAAAVMIALEQLAITAIGLHVMHIPPSRRPGEIERVIERLASHLSRRSETTLRELADIERGR